MKKSKLINELKEYFKEVKEVDVQLMKLGIRTDRIKIDGKYYGESFARKVLNDLKKKIEKDSIEYSERKLEQLLWDTAINCGGTDHKWAATTNTIYFNLKGKICRVSDHKKDEKYYFPINIVINPNIKDTYQKEYIDKKIWKRSMVEKNV